MINLPAEFKSKENSPDTLFFTGFGFLAFYFKIFLQPYLQAEVPVVAPGGTGRKRCAKCLELTHGHRLRRKLSAVKSLLLLYI